MSRATVRWIFDALPPSGARRGGDPSEHAFRHDLATLVREVVQNANDQAVGWPAVRFELIALRDERLAAFQQAIAWDTLVPHLEGAARTKGGAALGEFLAQLGTTRELLLLRVEDRNTEGLTGAESDGESHFRALCKDTLYSHKTSEAAGGSYGLGKSVLWTFSGLSIVLFNSVLLAHLGDQQSPRLIGRAELPSHEAAAGKGRRWFTGSGWLGREVRVKAGGARRAESLWGEGAGELATAAHLAREDRHGTTILIVGFRDPTSEQLDEIPRLVDRIHDAAVQYFWPAMVMDTRHLRISVGHEQGAEKSIVEPERSVAPFVECYRQRHEPSAALERVGDIVTRTISLELPRPRAGGGASTAQVDLVVRLAAEGRRDALRNHVALFRGPGMVVRYWDRSSLTIGMRPFHAILVCGLARNPRHPTAEDEQLERFLRAAEPPGHDDWLATARLKQTYQRGYAKALKTLKDRVSAELRKLLVSQPTQGERGPERLQRRFPIGSRGGRSAEPSPFRFSGLSAQYADGRWQVLGQIEPIERGNPWHARLTLAELGDDGRPIEPVAIAALELDNVASPDEGASDEGGAGEPGAGGNGQPPPEVQLSDGAAILHAPATTRCLSFRAISVPLANALLFPGELGVEIASELGPEVKAG